MLPAGHGYRTPGEGLVHLAHESTHAINSRIRNAAAPNSVFNAFFVGHGTACILREPRVPLSAIAQFVPAELRGPTSFNLYLVRQAGQWNDQPLYVLDEWTAYVNGAAVGLDNATRDNATRGGQPEPCELQQAIEFCGYATALLLAVERLDPAYPDEDKKSLQEFVAWQCERVWMLCERAKAMGPQAWSAGCEAAQVRFCGRFCKEVKE
jgi:hypothetical protein